MKSARLEREIRKRGVKLFRLMFTDLDGTRRLMTVTKTYLESALTRGVSFDSSSVGFGGVQHSDLVIKPDPASLKFNGDEALFFCDVCHPDGRGFEGDPRSLLKSMLKKLELRGMSFFVKPELEFHLAADGKPADEGIYLDPHADSVGYRILTDVTLAAEEAGLLVEKIHHENGHGQYEIEPLQYKNALHAADDIIFYKDLIERVSARYHISPLFLAKPFEGQAGNGMHVHQTLRRGVKNAFGDKTLTDEARYYIGGLLSHARALAAIVAPTENSYKRFGAQEAPVYVCWGFSNRSALVRIPAGSIRVELRSPDISSNPYLVFVSMLASGLDGMERKMEPPEHVSENVYALSKEELSGRGIGRLPSSLSEAKQELRKDEVLKTVLGDVVFRHLTE